MVYDTCMQINCVHFTDQLTGPIQLKDYNFMRYVYCHQLRLWILKLGFYNLHLKIIILHGVAK